MLFLYGVSVDEKKDHRLGWMCWIKRDWKAYNCLPVVGARSSKIIKLRGFLVLWCLIAKERWITIDSPRPSDPRLKALLDAELEK